jgi:hypothetical protein
VLRSFDDIVGLKYMRAVHLNDSKGTATPYSVAHTGIRILIVPDQQRNWTPQKLFAPTHAGELGCKKDRHENIGKGKIGLEAFRHATEGLPPVLDWQLPHDQ